MVNYLIQGNNLENLAEEHGHKFYGQKQILASTYCNYQLCSTSEGQLMVSDAEKKRTIQRKKKWSTERTITHPKFWTGSQTDWTDETKINWEYEESKAWNSEDPEEVTLKDLDEWAFSQKRQPDKYTNNWGQEISPEWDNPPLTLTRQEIITSYRPSNHYQEGFKKN